MKFWSEEKRKERRNGKRWYVLGSTRQVWEMGMVRNKGCPKHGLGREVLEPTSQFLDCVNHSEGFRLHSAHSKC
jgi:hypothetical protein